MTKLECFLGVYTQTGEAIVGMHWKELLLPGGVLKSYRNSQTPVCKFSFYTYIYILKIPLNRYVFNGRKHKLKVCTELAFLSADS